MSIPNFEFKHQSMPSDRSVKVGPVAVSREPLIIDFSSTYPNNQESAVTILSRSVVNSEVDVSGVLGNFVITDKLLDDDETYLFYEYQPPFDVAGSGIQVLNENGDPVPHKIEFAYIDPSGVGDNKESILTDTTGIDYDTLNGHSDIGIPSGIFTFAPFPNPSGDLGYQTHADSLAQGRISFQEFDDTTLPSESGTLDFTFLSKSDSIYRETFVADDWSISIGSGQFGIDANGVISGTGSIDDDTWYRGRLRYAPGVVELNVYRESLVASVSSATTIIPSGFEIDADKIFINNLVAYDHDVPTFDWNEPPVTPRYHHALRWNDGPVVASDHYRLRILTETNEKATLVYDAYQQDGSILQNRNERLNHVPIYKETITETHEWSRDENNLLLSGPIATASTIYIKPVFKGFISVKAVDNHVVVTNGSFKSDPFEESDGKYSYELLEYDQLPFETDNQNVVIPYSIKETKRKASIVSAYIIKVSPIVVFEGRYPDYTEPLTEDIAKTVSGGVVTSTTGTLDNITWRKTRGIRVYVNGVQLDQSDIRGFDVDDGLIFLNSAVQLTDDIEVTYLRHLPHFICNYPRIRPEVQEDSGWRIYLRPNFPNHFLLNPTDTLERLAYRKLVDGEPTGNLLSCTSNNAVTEFDGTIKLADISLVPVITITDERVFGGGLLPDSKLGGQAQREKDFPASIFYTNIATYQAEDLVGLSPYIEWPTVIIRIPSTVKAKVEEKFSTEAAALSYIKKSIEKHIALGVDYIIVDENNKLWDKPFPSSVPIPGQAEFEL